MAQGTTRGVPIDIDPALSNNSDLLVASQKATKTYVDNGLLNKQNVLSQATSSTNGYLSSTDWSTFNGKLDNNAWIDYSATSTIVGWSSLTTQEINYRVIGKQVFVIYFLSGTSNSTSTSFTLPLTSSNFTVENNNRARNNGVNYNGLGQIPASSSVINFSYWSALSTPNTTWTASGVKFVIGQITYMIP